MHYRHQGIERQTPKAFQVKIETENGVEAVWFPKSRCEVTGSHVECPSWLAKKKKLVEEKSFSDLLASTDAPSALAETSDDSGNEAEAALAREEVELGELSNVLDAIKKASELTGLSKAEILFLAAKAA